jgi:hypothetical protein
MTASCSASQQNTPPHSTNFMVDEFDCLPRPWRDLVNDFGWIIVRDMRLDGHRNAVKLRQELEAWRERQQERWLAEVPYPPRTLLGEINRGCASSIARSS